MCLGIPGELVELPDDETDLALVTVSGVRRKVNIGLLRDEEELVVGDWILIHVGFALAKIDEQEAAAALRVLHELGPAYDQELQDFATTDVG
ncbi:HypC/HybG/HupF family hydrogenase formation chaperone [Actinomycetospora endophytica]|uniref:HypC/HybG/HupF family hydrogenase formation chaperone n=1 Tax=Actinomycetospora endophytica TaxID=2291215 RepID=A0ABS8P704_9PSEU|nr:HypC/HybG/HupF family hydrogenase formation chaperone [Actinomycetospora endophytica]MCD2192834.1 HypC/HybG/HupF family hydrogenase formation chaperone [Actinomycetospora endophytica]